MTDDRMMKKKVKRKRDSWFWGQFQCEVVIANENEGDARVPAKDWYDVTDEYGSPFCKFTDDEFKFIQLMKNDNKLVINLKEFFGHVNWHQRALASGDIKELVDKKVISVNFKQCPEPEDYATFDAMLRYMMAKSGNVFRLLQCQENHSCLRVLKNTFTYKYLRELNLPTLDNMILMSSFSLDKEEKEHYGDPWVLRDKAKRMMLIASTLMRLECIKLRDLVTSDYKSGLYATVRPTQTGGMSDDAALGKVMELLNHTDTWMVEIERNYGLIRDSLTDVKMDPSSYKEDIDRTLTLVHTWISRLR